MGEGKNGVAPWKENQWLVAGATQREQPSALTPLISQLASSARLWTVGGDGWREARTQEEHANFTLVHKEDVNSSRPGRNGCGLLSTVEHSAGCII